MAEKVIYSISNITPFLRRSNSEFKLDLASKALKTSHLARYTYFKLALFTT